MKKLMFAGLSLLSLVVLMACGEEETKKTQAPEQTPKQQQQTTVQQIAVGKEAPDFTLQSMDGKEVKLSSKLISPPKPSPSHTNVSSSAKS